MLSFFQLCVTSRDSSLFIEFSLSRDRQQGGGVEVLAVLPFVARASNHSDSDSRTLEPTVRDMGVANDVPCEGHTPVQYGSISTSADSATHSDHTKDRGQCQLLLSADESSPRSLPGRDRVVNHPAHQFPDGCQTQRPDKTADPHTSSIDAKVSYWTLIRDNTNFRLYLVSYLVTHTGEWFTYVASLTAIEQIQASKGIVSRTSISVLVCLRLLPNVLLTSVGGVIADSRDRRVVMLVLDCVGACVALLFIFAYWLKSINAIYFVNVLQMIVASIYEPNRSSIVTQLVKDEEGLKKANIINGLAWSSMTAVGSFVGGFAAERFGIPVCFVIDSATYLISANLVWLISGEYNVSKAATEKEDGSSSFSLSQFTTMTRDGISYLAANRWGVFALFKFCSALVFGAADVLNVSFAERGNGGDLDGSSERLGLIFAFVGLGCFVGPLIFDHVTRMENSESLERSCLASYLLMAIGCFGMSIVTSFTEIYLCTAIRAGGSSVLWIYSSLLLQKFSSEQMLGRVLSVDYALATLGEAMSAFGGGFLQDDFGMSAEQVSFLMGVIATAAFFLWTIYLLVGRV